MDKKESTNKNEKALCIGSDPLCRKTYDPKLLKQESLKVDKAQLGFQKELVLDLKSLDVPNIKDVSCGFETYHCNYKIDLYRAQSIVSTIEWSFHFQTKRKRAHSGNDSNIEPNKEAGTADKIESGTKLCSYEIPSEIEEEDGIDILSPNGTEDTIIDDWLHSDIILPCQLVVILS